MSVPVTVERDGWSRQDSSLFGGVSQGCLTKTVEMKKEGVLEETANDVLSQDLQDNLESLEFD